MERTAVRTAGNYKTFSWLFFALAACVLFASISAFPVQTSALEVSTQQVLPPGGSACAPTSAVNFTPYIYEGELHSFEFTLPDASYVALLGSVGNTPISFQQMTRSVNPAGNLRIHVDIASTPISGTLPLKVILLSARSGQPVCMATVSMSVGSGPVQYNPVVSPIPAPVYAPPSTYVPISSTPSVSTPKPAPSPTPKPVTPATSSAGTGKMGTTAGPVVTSTMQSRLRSICSSDTSAYRLWLILLVLYALIVGAALWAEFPMSLSWARTPERIATIILVLLLLLLGFWYFSVSCRAALWMPLVAFLIAVLGLLAAFWNHPRVTQLLLIQETKNK